MYAVVKESPILGDRVVEGAKGYSEERTEDVG